jgi:hypothetical protein
MDKRPFLLGAVGVLLAGIAHASAFDPHYETHFDSADALNRWVAQSGSWTISGGRFVDGQTGATDIATVEYYDPDNIQWQTMGPSYAIDVYARVQNTAL